MKLMLIMDSYWDMLPPELHEFILMLKGKQEMLDQEKGKKNGKVRRRNKIV